MSRSGEACAWNSHLLTCVTGALVQISLLPGPSTSTSRTRSVVQVVFICFSLKILLLLIEGAHSYDCFAFFPNSPVCP